MYKRWFKPLNVIIGMLMVLGMFAASAVSVRAGSAHKAAAAPTGQIVYSDWEFPDTFNPFEAGLATDYEEMYLTMPSGQSLYYGAKGNLLPGFLQRVPTTKNGGVSKNGKTIKLFVRKGLRWSNGQPITAADAKFAWQIAMDPNIASCTGTCDNIGSITVKGKYELIWHMKKVYSAAIPNAWTGFIPHSWSKLGGNAHKAAVVESDKVFTYENSSYVTAGPYQISQFSPSNRVVLTPNKYYHAMGGRPRVAKYIFAFYSDKNTMIAAAARRETDQTQDYTLSDLPVLGKHRSAFTTKYVSALSPEHIELNMLDKTVGGHPNPLVNLKVRQAINLAIDRYGIIKSAFGTSNKTAANAAISYDEPWVETTSIKQPFANPKITGAWDPLRKQWLPYSATTVADAKKLLQGTPCASGCTVTLTTTAGNTQRAAEAAVIQSNLAKIGITLSFVPQSVDSLFGTWKDNGALVHGNFEMAMFAYVGVSPEPDGWKENMTSKYIQRLDPTHSPIDSNNAGLRNKSVDRDFEFASHTFNSALRRNYYYQAQIVISKQVPWIVTSIRPVFCTYDSKVKGVTMDGYAIACQWNGYGWKAAR